MLSDEQTKQIKEQLIEQVEKNFPDDKKQIFTDQIISMNSKELEEFLKQNNMKISDEEQKCLFCSIAQSETSSYKLDETESAVAVLEINPISNAHALIIPKQHLASEKEIPKEIFVFAKEISKKIKEKFKPKKVDIISSNLFGHEILNLLPIYDNEKISSQRKKANENELKEIQKKFQEKVEKQKSPKTKSKKEKPKEELEKEIEMISEIGKIPWLPLRIP